MTLAEVYGAWMETKSDGLSSSSVVGYEAAWKNLLPLEDLCITGVRTNDYQKIVDKMKSTKSRSACSKVKILVSQLCKWAIQNDILDKNYGEFITLPVEKKSDTKMIFSDEEINLLWATEADPVVQIILVMIYTGMRINELFSLKPSDVHLDEQITSDRRVSYFVGGEKTEAGRDRVIVIHSRVLPIVREWMSRGGKYLLTNSNGGMIDDRNWRTRSYYPTLERLGIERVSPHKARHTFATRGAKAGIPQTVLQNLLGHAKYDTTADYYTHVDILQLADGIELIDS
jgi:integrase